MFDNVDAGAIRLHFCVELYKHVGVRDFVYVEDALFLPIYSEVIHCVAEPPAIADCFDNK